MPKIRVLFMFCCLLFTSTSWAGRVFEVFNPWWTGTPISTEGITADKGWLSSTLSYTASSCEGLLEALKDALARKVSQIDVKFYPYMSVDDLETCLDSILNHKLLEMAMDIPNTAVWTHIGGYYKSIGTQVTEVSLSISYTYGSEDEQWLREKAADIVASLITPDMSAVQIERIIHDWLVLHVSYDYNYSEDCGNNWCHTDYGALKHGKAVCDGYSYLMARLLNMAGVRTKVVLGVAVTVRNSMEENCRNKHMWNLVQIGDSWSHLDVTWDDWDNEKIYYFFFNKQDTYMLKWFHLWGRYLGYGVEDCWACDDACKRIAQLTYPKVLDEPRDVCAAPSSCSIFSPNQCKTEDDCLRISGTWHNGQCTLSFDVPTYSCDEEHLTLCRTKEDCESWGGVWLSGVCLPESWASPRCSALGGHFYNGKCCKDFLCLKELKTEEDQCNPEQQTGQRLKRWPVPQKKSVSIYSGDPSDALVEYDAATGTANIAVSFDSPVDVLVGLFSCDFSGVWWLDTKRCSFSARKAYASQITELVCENVKLPVTNGWIVWMVSPIPLESLNWKSDPFELTYMEIGRCR